MSGDVRGVAGVTIVVAGNPEALASTAAVEVVQIDGLDDDLQRPDDVGGSVLALKGVVETMDQFLAGAPTAALPL